MASPEKQAAMRLLNAMVPTAFSSDPQLFQMCTALMTELSLTAGNSELSPIAYCVFSQILYLRGNLDTAYWVSQIALDLLELSQA